MIVRRVFLIVLMSVLFIPSAGHAQDMTCDEYLQMRQGDVDTLNEAFASDQPADLFIMLYTLRHKYEDLTPPECAQNLNQLMIASIAANEDVIALSFARFVIDDWEDRAEQMGDRIQLLIERTREEVELIEQSEPN